MTLHTLRLAILISTLALGFSACSKSDGETMTTITSIAIDVNCEANSTASDIATYITTISGDDIVQDETNTTVSIFIDADGVSKVCLEGGAGAAHIERQE